VPGTDRCNGQQPQNCSTAGAWQDNGAACIDQQTCVGGACTGANCSTYTAPVCNGTATCDLHSNTCCVTPALPPTGVCVAGNTATCASGASPFHCQYACECPTGESCCGVINTTNLSGSATCQAVANGGSCTAQTSNQATAQLCKQDAECKNGQRCIAQTCTLGAKFQFCGVQNAPPFNCKADAADAGH
jgi:hypothetical protein